MIELKEKFTLEQMGFAIKAAQKLPELYKWTDNRRTEDVDDYLGSTYRFTFEKYPNERIYFLVKVEFNRAEIVSKS